MKRTLFCFPTAIEARPFLRKLDSSQRGAVLICGIGPANAVNAVQQRVSSAKPERVLSCGFAGALDPELEIGDVVFHAPGLTVFELTLEKLGARRARFYQVEKVLWTASEKLKLRSLTTADAVDMESAAIAAVCTAINAEFGIVRVVSDTAHEDLPVDFNRFLLPAGGINTKRLFSWLVARPSVMIKVLRWHARLNSAAAKLAEVLYAASQSICWFGRRDDSALGAHGSVVLF